MTSRKLHAFFFVTYLLFTSCIIIHGEDNLLLPCSICVEGSLQLPDKLVSLPGVAGEFTCDQLNSFLPLLYPDSTDPDCQAIQSVGSLCGCPTPDNACSVCNDDAPMTFPDRPLEFFSDMFGGIAPNCELVGAFLLTSHTEDETTCTAAQSFLAEYCGCPESMNEANNPAAPCSLCADGSPITLPDEEINMEGFPFNNCKQLDEAVSLLFTTASDQCAIFQSVSTLCGCPKKENACTMCPDEGPMAFPDKSARFLKDLFGGTAPSCKVYEAYAHSLDNASDECQLVQSTSGFCGCAAVENHCHVCEVGDEVKPEYEEVEIDPVLLAIIGVQDAPFAVTCEFVEAMELQLKEDDPICRTMQTRRDVCGCNNGIYVYADAENEKDKRVLAWLPSLSGSLSLLGALAIIFDVVRDKKNRRQIYNQLVATMSIFDILSSMAYIVSTAANPTNDLWPVYGERGNDATCTAQAFFVQLSLTSVAYNVSLSMYYYMSVVLGLRGSKLKAKVKYLHIFPLTLGLTLAFAGIPFYGSILLICHIPAPPFADSWAPLTWLMTVPIFTAITICTVLVLLVWLKVHRQVAISAKWAFGSSAMSRKSGSQSVSQPTTPKQPWWRRARTEKPKLTTIQRVERSVMWQALNYVIIFYVSWISNLILIRRSTKDQLPYEFYCAVLFLIPLHPFLNSLNYFRPRIGRYFRRSRLQKFLSKKGKPTEVSDDIQPNRGGESTNVSSGCSTTNAVKQSESDNDQHASNEFDLILEPSAYLASEIRGSGETTASEGVLEIDEREMKSNMEHAQPPMAYMAEES